MAEKKYRHYIIDEDTIVGYDYLNKHYYVTNKDTTTTRATATQTKHVLDIVAPNNDLSIADIQYLEDHYETIEKLTYTLSDLGDYISTVQINDCKQNPLTLNAEKHALYIMNTNIVFDLSLDEGMPSKVATVQDYFKRQQGIFIEPDDMLDLLTLLQDQYYNSTTYLQVQYPQTTEEPIKYSNVISVRDYTDTSRVHYSLTLNPTQEYNHPTIANISEINSNRVFTLTNYNLPLSIQVGDTVGVVNSTNQETATTSDGTYTVSAIELPYIKVAESINTYQTVYKPVHLVAPVLSVTSASRENNTLTISTPVPNSILTGDTIYLEGTTQTIDFQEVSIDGIYTVKHVSNDVITVEEQLPTDYTKKTETNTLTKRVLLGDLLGVHASTLTISKPIPTLTNQTILVEDKYYLVASNTENTITVVESIEEYEPPYAELQIPVPYTYVLSDITKSDRAELPTGMFMLDDYTESNSYLALGTGMLPTDEQYDNANKLVPTEYHVSDRLPNMHLMGLYSEIYAGN